MLLFIGIIMCGVVFGIVFRKVIWAFIRLFLIFGFGIVVCTALIAFLR